MEFNKILTDDILKSCPITLLGSDIDETNLTNNTIGDLGLINHDFVLTINNNTYKFKVNNEGKRRELDNYLRFNRPNKCKIDTNVDTNKIIITAIFFSDRLQIFGKGLKDHDVSIYYKDKVMKNLTPKGLIKSLAIESNGKNYFLINTGQDTSTIRPYDDNTMQAIDDKDFSIYGDNVIVFIKKIVINNDYALSIEKILPNSWNKSVNYLKIAQGTLEFTNKATALSALVSGTMDNLIKDNSSYLKIWDEYGEIEGNVLLEKARSFAMFTQKEFKKSQLDKGQLALYFNQPLPVNISTDDKINIEQTGPNYLENPDLKWREYVKKLDNDLATKRKIDLSIDRLDRKKNRIVLDFNNKYDNVHKPYITLSVLGDEIQIKRRNDARRALLDGSSANPLLGLIIEKDGLPPIPKKRNSARTKTLSSFVQNKIFKNSPTSKQLEAIDLALNTPDIALIQGPPGTGKTTVITAILERLNEEYDLSNSINGKILITGSQHDAVENVISRLSLNDIPTIKFGSKGNSSVINNELLSWFKNISQEIKKKNPEIEKESSLNDLDRFANAYMITKKDEDALLFIKETILNKSHLFPLEVINDAKFIRDNIKPKENDSKKLLIVRQLRTNISSFNDDGQWNAQVFYREFIDELLREEKDTLKQAIRANTNGDMSFLKDLEKLRLKFLDEYLPTTKYLKPKLRSDVVNLIKTVRKTILDRNKFNEDPKTSILYDFVNELDNNVNGIREALKDYNVAFSATTQQSEGKEIHEAKKKKNQRLVYDTVIIDEAARVSPRDLLVPMVQAQNRIILVGDHRQLPHIIDEKITKDLEDGHTADEVDYINKSMFQYLFDRLKILEQRDGIKRTVTLDAQYRMHPLLGKFASDNFYKEHGEDFDSPLDGSLFNHNLSGIDGKQAIWINVENGNEKRHNSSRLRQSEATKIAEQLNTWIKSDEGKDLTFGVISFYSAQVNIIFKELETYGLTHKTSSGKFEIMEEYREKLRIGTVDSFQGMEFDIVFLSTVRTYDPSSKTHNYQRTFGFLTSKNRLCVSMTRQKKALILVGDSRLFSSTVAQKGVPEIYDFYELCLKEGKII